MKMIKSRIFIILSLILYLFCLPACGNEDDTISREGRDYFVVETTERELETPAAGDGWKLLGMQYYEDEVIQIWGERKVNEQLQSSWDVYLYREDGSSEFLFGGVAPKYRTGWFLGDEGNCYVLLRDAIVKLDEEGKELYSRTYDMTFTKLYQVKNDWMMLGKTAEGEIAVVELDVKTGDITEQGRFPMEEDRLCYLTGQEEGIFLLNRAGAWKVNPADGTKESILSFEETRYTLSATPVDFRVTEEGVVQLLQSGKVLELARTNLGETKNIIIVEAFSTLAWVKEYIDKFNAESQEYYVVLEEAIDDYGSGNGVTYEDRLRMELVAGEGPDIFFLSSTDWMALREKGVFEPLNTYMEQSGIREEDYFPATFDVLRDGEAVYTISPLMSPMSYWIDESVLGSSETPGIEELLDAMLAYEEEAVWGQYTKSTWILKHLLIASDSLFGMVDWETGACDFEVELFAKLLQVSKRYGCVENENRPSIAGNMNINSFYFYDTLAKRQAEGMVAFYHYFDDGCYPAANSTYALAINSASPVKEGTWEFLQYLLEGELQEDDISASFPARKSGYEARVKTEIEEGSFYFYTDESGETNMRVKAGKGEYASLSEASKNYEAYRAANDLTEEKAAEIREHLEAMRALPTRTGPILTIILEEAGAYFAGSKTIEEIIPIIENRVQLYLDEQN